MGPQMIVGSQHIVMGNPAVINDSTPVEFSPFLGCALIIGLLIVFLVFSAITIIKIARSERYG